MYYRGDTYGFRGDYYRGDYYRGDPGLFSFIGKALGGVAGVALKVIKGNLGLGGPSSVPMLPASYGSGATMFASQPGSQYGLINISRPPNIDGGGPLVPGPMGATTLPGVRGMHLNKSTYETRGGGTSRWGRGLQLHPKGTVLVRNRRMNVGNARALKRSLRRAHGFARLAMRTIKLLHPKKPGTFGGFKKHRKK